jgi:sugar (pentulose or hexulose) kinase
VLLGLDVGTTACKAAVVSSDGRELAQGRVETPWRRVATGAEIDVPDLLAAVRAAARDALATVPDADVVGVGVTSMAESGILLDDAGRPLVPLIAWHDSRGTAEMDRLASELGVGAFGARTGVRLRPVPSIGKYAWLRRHVPGASAAARWLNVADLVVRELGGLEVAERSLASRMGLLDQATGDWWPEALAWADWDRALLAPLVEAGEPCGRVRKGELPGCDGAALAVAGQDHLAAAIGAGVVADGDVLDSCGTAEAFVRAIPGPLAPERVAAAAAAGVAVGAHVIPDRWALLAGSLGGLVLRRFLDLLGVDETGRADLAAAAVASSPGTGSPIVPGGDVERAILAGMGSDVEPGRVWRAAVEYVQREARGVLDAIESIAGPAERMVAVGGWMRDPAVRTVKSEILGPFEWPAVREAGARGAALIAGVAAGLYEDVRRVPPPSLGDPP